MAWFSSSAAEKSGKMWAEKQMAMDKFLILQKSVLRVLDCIWAHSTEFVCLCMAPPIFFTTPSGRRQGPASDQQKADGYLSCSRRAQTGMTLPEKLNKSRQPVTNRASFGCMKLSEEVHVILNRFYIVQKIFILPDFADGVVLFSHQADNEVLSSSTRGQTLSSVCTCVHEGTLELVATVHCSYSKRSVFLIRQVA